MKFLFNYFGNLIINYWPFESRIKSYLLFKKYILKIRIKGSEIHIDNDLIIDRPLGVIMGNNIVFKGNNTLKSMAGIVIGDDVVFEKNVNVLSQDEFKYGPVVIGSGNVISSNIGLNTFLPNKSNKSGLFGITKPVVFVVSTGRSGSKAIASLLSQNPEIDFWHDPYPHLNVWANELLYNYESKEVMKNKLTCLFSAFDFRNGITYGISDQKISPFIGILHELFPNAKFIWLIRKADDFVNSSYPRGWFDNSEFGFPANPKEFFKKEVSPAHFVACHRTNGFLLKKVSEAKWRNMTGFERNCWYWNYWNRMIEKQLKEIPSNLWKRVKLKDLNNGIPDVQKFIGTQEFPILTNTINKAHYKKLKTEDWNTEMKELYNIHCSKLLSEIF